MVKLLQQDIKVDCECQNELPFLISLLINQKSGDENNINTWHQQEPHFIPNQKPTLQTLALQTYGFTPHTRWCHDL